MIKKSNASKFWGLLLAVVIVLALYAVLAVQTETSKEKPSSSATPNVASANNVSMKLISAHTEGKGYRVEMCYDLPDQRDWLLTYPNAPLDTTLSVAGIEARPVEEGTMYWKYDPGGKIVQRCQYLFFAIQIPAQAKSISLNIRTLYAREPGQSDYCLETSQKMAERNYTITIDCMEVNNFEGPVYVKFPVELLSFDPVFKNIFRDVRWDTHAGPWSFTFPVNPP
ncbi:MAG TPA: hypothetical protein PLA27_00555 [Anaerolineales bacterium]|jgi:hypothetical protein|nr:hypothetical protein [Anaerolineales bacterium]